MHVARVRSVATLSLFLSAALASSSSAQTSHHPSNGSVPRLAPIYVGEPGGVGAGTRVFFEQEGPVLWATWTLPMRGVYSRSKMIWQPGTKSFAGTSVMRTMCNSDDQPATRIEYTVKEEIHVVDHATIRNRWTKPLRFDCDSGVVEVFKWSEVLWRTPEEPEKK